MERVQKKMVTGGVGSKNNFSLDWERLFLVLIFKGLSVSDQKMVTRGVESKNNFSLNPITDGV